MRESWDESWVMGKFLEERWLLGVGFGSLSHAAYCGDGHDEGLLEKWRGRCKAVLE